MQDPPVATVYYRPENPEGERVIVYPEPIDVPRGLHTLIWIREREPVVPWRFQNIEFDRPEIFSNLAVRNRVMTVLDDNATAGNHGTIKYTLSLIDEATGAEVVQDPQIENEFGGDPPTNQ